ncbi:MAG: hypothetical protein V8S38_12510 [Lachnospiraceae bacterium]
MKLKCVCDRTSECVCYVCQEAWRCEIRQALNYATIQAVVDAIAHGYGQPAS